MSNVELYAALKGSIPETAARMIAEVVPPARELATSRDVATVLEKLAEVRAELSREIHVESVRTMRWMLTFFIPVWAGTWATVVAIVLKS